jgi:hypothetical protein
MGELYRLDFASGKSYIGVAFTTALRRYTAHARQARRGNQQLVYRAWRKHGAPKLVVLAALPHAELWRAEQCAIAAFGTFAPGGYNMTADGSSPPIVTPEVGRKISAALTGRKLSDKHRKNVAAAVLGRKHTAEARVNMSRAQKGKTFSKKHRAKLAAAKLGTTRPVEIRMKMSASQRARRIREGCTPRYYATLRVEGMV